MSKNTLSSSQQKFLTLFPNLSPLEQQILKCIAISYEHTGKTKLMQSLVAAGVKNDSDQRIIGKNITECLNSLKDQGLVRTDSKGSICIPDIRELLCDIALKDNSFRAIAKAIEELMPTMTRWDKTPYLRSYEHGIRELRIKLYLKKDDKEIISLLHKLQSEHIASSQRNSPFSIIFHNQPNEKLLLSLSWPVLQELAIPHLNNAFFGLEPVDTSLESLANLCLFENREQTELPSAILLHYVCKGKLTEARAFLANLPSSSNTYSYLGWIACIEGNIEQSLHFYREGLALMKIGSKKRKFAYSNFAGFFFPVALLLSEDLNNIKEALTYLPTAKKHKNYLNESMWRDLQQALLFHTGQRNKAKRHGHSLDPMAYVNFYDFASLLIAFLTLRWQGHQHFEEDDTKLAEMARKAKNNGYFWFAQEALGLLSSSKHASKSHKEDYKKFAKNIEFPALFDAIKQKPKWQQVLNALTNLDEKKVVQNSSKQERLIWVLDLFNSSECNITPRLQKLGKSGKWTKGRAVALSTLQKETNNLSYLTSQDINVVAAIRKNQSSSYYYSNSTTYSFNEAQALEALVNHPSIFLEGNLTLPVELSIGAPELHIIKNKNGYKMHLYPYIEPGLSYRILQESPTRIRLTTTNKEYSHLSDIIGASITIPLNQKEKILNACARVAKIITIQSDIGETSQNAVTAEANPTPHCHLTPSDSGLLVNMLCKPFANSDSYYPPGVGGKNVLAEIDGTQTQTIRNLELEKENTKQIIAQCPTLQHYTPFNNEWVIEPPEDCLELLTELQNMGEQIVVKWPKDESLKVIAQASYENLSLKIKKDNNWFEATGKLAVNDELILDMKELLTLCENSTNRFIQLDDGKFLALSKRFKQQLDELQAYSQKHKEGIRFNTLASLAIEEFTQNVEDCTTDKHWRDTLKQFQNYDDIELPSTLQATLRGYQLEGFKWLSRLSSWQIGACLADDMGLGKTVQALAAILLRAPVGPTLVVSPTSVMMNWIDEAKRFAPTLNVQIFAEGDRQENLDKLESFDLVICSYGLLHTESEKLSEVQWQTVVLDEAQAIKNMHTKRSKAAMSLDAQFRVITTGTPIENHLGELWNLFRFINPGLLGSYDNFKTKFSTPIEKDKDMQAAEYLRKLIQPFILRRLKRDVLQELPSRTEVNIQVEMSKEEAAMYEAQRQLAVETLTSEKKSEDQQYFQVLAELTKLRRFCCNPQLVVPDLQIPSTKLEIFTKITMDLLENKHKALVFSQFVGHLSLIRKRLDDLGISYQYLDGSTTTKQRTQRVKDFQSGKGDLFLISLKAGGAGLNLTAADYVIHMDPWWNPAVEDQASDRAHRIGQKRPVTIYRLIVKNSIEEKIVGLHQEKRDLADSLLSGSDISGSFSANQLFALLQEK